MDWIIHLSRDLIESSFAIIESLGNNANIAFFVLGSIAGVYWIIQMIKQQKDEVPNR